MMPDMDGWSVCREIRQHSDVPIIMVTAREQKVDIVKGLKLGADDYITKPFNEEELVARMNALLRRAKPATMLRWMDCYGIGIDSNCPIRISISS